MGRSVKVGTGSTSLQGIVRVVPATDRAYRIGQGKPVFVYKLVASGTVEEKMLELQARKAGLADSLLSGVAGTAALTAQDFDELFRPLGAA